MFATKMCVVCNRLLNQGVTKCTCGGEVFIGVILDFTEEEQDVSEPIQEDNSK